MRGQRETDHFERELYLAGERVPPGIYQEMGKKREVHLDCEDYLPASLDGQVACFVRVDPDWSLQQAVVTQQGDATISTVAKPSIASRNTR
jgi:hypothetical protein